MVNQTSKAVILNFYSGVYSAHDKNRNKSTWIFPIPRTLLTTKSLKSRSTHAKPAYQPYGLAMTVCMHVTIPLRQIARNQVQRFRFRKASSGFSRLRATNVVAFALALFTFLLTFVRRARRFTLHVGEKYIDFPSIKIDFQQRSFLQSQ